MCNVPELRATQCCESPEEGGLPLPLQSLDKASKGGSVWARSWKIKKPCSLGRELQEEKSELKGSVQSISHTPYPPSNRKRVEVVKEWWCNESLCVEGCFPSWDLTMTMETDNKWQGHQTWWLMLTKCLLKVPCLLPSPFLQGGDSLREGGRDGRHHPESHRKGEGSQQGYGLGKPQRCFLLQKTSAHTLSKSQGRDCHSTLSRKGLKHLDAAVMKTRQQLTSTFMVQTKLPEVPVICNGRWLYWEVVDGMWVGLPWWLSR